VSATRRPPIQSRTFLLVLALLAIEFLDEFVFGAREAAWPLIRTDLGLSYVHIGLLLSVPSLLSSLIEPVLGILGDVWRRRVLVLGGGLLFGVALLLTALSQGFPLLLLSFVLLYPASGAFVSLSQATLMDLAPARRQHNMARWTFAGSLGLVAGPLVLGAATTLGLGWRGVFAGFAGLTLVVLATTWRVPHVRHPVSSRERSGVDGASFKAGVLGALRALRRRQVLRWLVLLEFADLLMDVLLGFLALYFVDVVGTTEAQAAAAVAVWTGVGLLGDLLLIPLLERIQPLRYLRLSAVVELVLFVALLGVPLVWAKFGLLALLGLFNAGWYSILQAELYAAMPGQSGTVITLTNVAGLVGGLMPLGLGLMAQQVNLQATMWLLLLGPAALLLGLPQLGAASSSPEP
jgi:FSR family fosmidomycin resistance protein-like MFS transporter